MPFSTNSTGNTINISLDVIESAFNDINRLSIELTKITSEFDSCASKQKAQEILVKINVLLSYMVSIRNQLMIYKRLGGLTITSTAKEYLGELKVQADSLKSMAYSFGAIFSAYNADERKYEDLN